jgi:hypothetical protein
LNDSTKPLTPVNLRFTPQTNGTGNAVRLTTQIMSDIRRHLSAIFRECRNSAAMPFK